MSVNLQPNFEALGYSDAELDFVYHRLSPSARKQADLAIQIGLARRSVTNVRQGSTTWLGEQRETIKRMLCEAEETVLDAGLDSAKFDSFCDDFAQRHWKPFDIADEGPGDKGPAPGHWE